MCKGLRCPKHGPRLEQCDCTPLSPEQLDVQTSGRRQPPQCCLYSARVMIRPQDPPCGEVSYASSDSIPASPQSSKQAIGHSSSCSMCPFSFPAGFHSGSMTRRGSPLLSVQTYSEAGPELSHVYLIPIMLTPWPCQRCPQSFTRIEDLQI